MKFSKSLFLAFAGLGLFACSSEEVVDNTQLPDGVGAVTINIVSPSMSRAIVDGTAATTVPVTGDVVISLEAGNGPQSITLEAADLAVQQSVTFWNVENPSKITVSMNDGEASYVGEAPTIFTGDPAGVPAYGETQSFILTANTASPGDKGGAVYETGANSGDENKTYQLYTASVKLAIPVARLEVSGIQHIITGEHEAGTDGKCAYNKLYIAGVYLDNVYAEGTGVTYANGAFPCASGTPTDYSYDGTDATGTGAAAILKDAATVTDFLTANQTWPETADKAYAYYFYGANGAENLPKFKIYFNQSEAKDASYPLPAPRYAMITKYTKANEGGGTTEITKFEPGHIYRITSAKLTDENIIGDEGGNTLYGVVVTVTEAAWTVETIGAEWAK